MAIGDIKTRLRAKFSRRHSNTSTVSSVDADLPPKTARSTKSRASQRAPSTVGSATIDEQDTARDLLHPAQYSDGDRGTTRAKETSIPEAPNIAIDAANAVGNRKGEVGEGNHREEVINGNHHHINNNTTNNNNENGKKHAGGGNLLSLLRLNQEGNDRQVQTTAAAATTTTAATPTITTSTTSTSTSTVTSTFISNTKSALTSPPASISPNDFTATLHPLRASLEGTNDRHKSSSTADFISTPTTDIPSVPEEDLEEDGTLQRRSDTIEFQLNSFDTPSHSSVNTPSQNQKPPELPRRQSLLPHQQTRLIKTLLETDLPAGEKTANPDYFTNNGPSTISPNMVSRKIWVKRPGASATLVTIHEDDLVDDVRDMILKKYANSLGRNFDAPDVTLRIVPREKRQERTLGPEEPMGRTLDAYYPGGQAVDEALVIDVPLRRTPKPSPQPNHRYYDEHRPAEGGSDYFPPMPAPVVPSPQLPHSLPVNGPTNPHHGTLTSHSMSVLTTGHVPALPSPGSARRHHRERPRIGRQHTSSPTVINTHNIPILNNGTQVFHRGARSRTHSSASEKSAGPPVAPPLPTPPPQNDLVSIPRVATPPPRVSSPRPVNTRPSKKKKVAAEHPSLPAGMLNGAVPPINVLIVEDNIINLKLLEAFMKRLKVRWQTAMNGREAVNKWRAGGFHLVLMDIQLPIMSGLEATKEIRRLERLNSIGVFSSSASSSAPEKESNEPEGEDKLPSTVLFKSPVIIVALTASSLQSDRHEALAAGCNDFLTKPVNFVWLERKVMEWGCMQALIDFDGWRKWKDFSQNGIAEDGKPGDGKKGTLAGKKKKNRQSLGSQAGASSTRLSVHEENKGPGA